MTVRIDEHGCLIVGNCALPAAAVPAVEAFYREQFERAGVVAEERERRAPVQASRGIDAGPAGTIAWSEHLEVWQVYAQKHGSRQDAERIAARGGFGYGEIVLFTGNAPRTFMPVEQEGQVER